MNRKHAIVMLTNTLSDPTLPFPPHNPSNMCFPRPLMPGDVVLLLSQQPSLSVDACSMRSIQHISSWRAGQLLSWQLECRHVHMWLCKCVCVEHICFLSANRKTLPYRGRCGSVWKQKSGFDGDGRTADGVKCRRAQAV